jgi:hypothetical protein
MWEWWLDSIDSGHGASVGFCQNDTGHPGLTDGRELLSRWAALGISWMVLLQGVS